MRIVRLFIIVISFKEEITNYSVKEKWSGPDLYVL